MKTTTRATGGADVRAPTVQARPYQVAAIEAVRQTYRRGQRSALLVLATGTGKTFSALSMAAATIERGGRVLWLAHRSELVEQPVKAWQGLAQFRDVGDAGIVQGDRNDAGAALVCASTQTVGLRANDPAGRLAGIFRAPDVGPIRLVVVDECHHYADDEVGLFSAVLPAVDRWALHVGAPSPFRLGLTATPERMDGRNLAGVWGSEPAYVYSYARAIADGYLCPPRVVLDRLELDDDTRAKVAAAREAGNEDDREVARALQDAGLVEWTADAMGRHVRGRSVLAFVCDLAQARDLSADLNGRGWRSAVVSGETPKAQRRALLRQFEAGAVDVLVNCNVLTEGTDLPRCDAVVMARPFASKVLFIQAVGRGLRLYPGKTECIVLDVLGATEEHSLTHAAALLSGDGPKREPFTGVTRRRVGDIAAGVERGVRVLCQPRDPAEIEKGDPRGYVIVAIVIGDDHTIPVSPPIPVERGRDVVADGDRGGTPLRDLEQARDRTEAHWVPVPGAVGGAMVAHCGDHGRIWLVRHDAGWMSYHVVKGGRKPRPLEIEPMDVGLARGLADDLFRQASNLVRSRAPWRDREATPAQIAAAERLRLTVAGDTRGAYADALTADAAGKFWSRHGADVFAAALDARRT